MHLVVNPFMIIEKMEAYLLLDESTLQFYASESIIDTILSYAGIDDSLTGLTEGSWYKLTFPLSELDIDLSEFENNEDINIDLEKVFTEDNFKYVGRKGLSTKHYVLTVDKKFISNIMEKYNLMDELGADSIDLDELGDFSEELQESVKHFCQK